MAPITNKIIFQDNDMQTGSFPVADDVQTLPKPYELFTKMIEAQTNANILQAKMIEVQTENNKLIQALLRSKIDIPTQSLSPFSSTLNSGDRPSPPPPPAMPKISKEPPGQGTAIDQKTLEKSLSSLRRTQSCRIKSTKEQPTETTSKESKGPATTDKRSPLPLLTTHSPLLQPPSSRTRTQDDENFIPTKESTSNTPTSTEKLCDLEPLVEPPEEVKTSVHPDKFEGVYPSEIPACTNSLQEQSSEVNPKQLSVFARRKLFEKNP